MVHHVQLFALLERDIVLIGLKEAVNMLERLQVLHVSIFLGVELQSF